MSKLPTALYGRTSADDKKAATIQAQQSDLRKWAETDEQVERVVGEYWDEGVSGKIPFDKRPAGGRLASDVASGAVKCVAVVYADRFGRTLLDALQAARDLEAMGASIVCVHEGWDARRKDSPLNFQIRLILAEEEHRRIGERMEGGKVRAAARDGAPPGFPVCFGYRLDARGRYLIHPAEAAIVQGVFEMCLAGHSNWEILEWVKEQGVKPGRRSQRRDGEAYIQSCHANAQWSRGRIGRILRCRVYTGVRVWRGVEFSCPPIVDADTFARAQEVNAKRSEAYTPRVNPSEALLSGLFTCGMCGQGVYFHRYKSIKRPDTTGRRNQYQCAGKSRAEPCKSKYLPVHLADKMVWEMVEGYLSNPEELIRKAVSEGAQVGAEIAQSEATEAELHGSLQALESEVASLWEEQEQHGWPMQWITPKLARLNDRRKAIERDMQASRKAKFAADDRRAESAAIIPAITAIRAKLAAGVDPATRHEIIRRLIGGGVLRTIGKGRAKKAELHISLKWGEIVESEVNPSTSGRDANGFTVEVSLSFPAASTVQP